jgi:hypothetical protein
MNRALGAELVAMAREDQQVRAELAADGSLFQGYHPRMEAIHRKNAARLTAIIDEHGWPGRSMVGEEGARAAWLILQHAIGEPPLQRRGLRLLKEAMGDVLAAEVAMLEDRVSVLEGRPQVYGTQFDWDENGEMSPSPIADPDHVDERRRAVGLGPLEERIREMRAGMAGERPPTDWRKRRQQAAEWARSVGWRDH